MRYILKPIKPAYIVITLATVALIAIAYDQYQAYQQKIQEEARKVLIENSLRQAREFAEENRKHPLMLPYDPLAPAEDPLGRTPPSDAEEMANIKLWQQLPPEQRQKLMPAPEKLALPAEALAQIDATQAQPIAGNVPKGNASSALPANPATVAPMPEDTEPSPLELQAAVKEMQKKALEQSALRNIKTQKNNLTKNTQ